VRNSTPVSIAHHLICPLCESGELRFADRNAARCLDCGYTAWGAVLETLVQIITLPDALGHHACECGHPEMRRLPGGVLHCPACGSEVLPAQATPGLPRLASKGKEVSDQPVTASKTTSLYT